MFMHQESGQSCAAGKAVSLQGELPVWPHICLHIEHVKPSFTIPLNAAVQGV